MGQADLPLEALLRRVALGLAHWSELNQAGYAITRSEGIWHMPCYDGPSARMTRLDFKQALRNLAHSPLQVQEWASFILASDMIGIDADDEDELLNELWNVAFGE